MKTNINRIAVDLDSELALKLRTHCTINGLTMKEYLSNLIKENLE